MLFEESFGGGIGIVFEFGFGIGFGIGVGFGLVLGRVLGPGQLWLAKLSANREWKLVPTLERKRQG